ncbi:T9SS type A sorting domain-containing protein [Hymenobacter sp. BT664]|uniref:T9SS type A sorting domain-containing protein n=1 Tax=Hymenobacter montanus TaxID=2771359 RepID=A0A927BB24_9BACT|nr:T9SS type A sorting domain-containing protein [Hymenobacter montanus]MBD2766832.1 T9SS type A sorting domain-containing protein [Hymenobacter montanus]
MKINFYALPLAISSQWRQLVVLVAGVLLAPAAAAQIQVPAGNPNAGTGRKPLATNFGYERSALIYTAAEIATSGTLTQLAFYLNGASLPGATPTKVYLKTVSNSAFAAPTTVAAEEAGATLVYNATIPAAAFTANTWITLPLTTPFAYDGIANLEVIVETNATGNGSEGGAAKIFRYSSTGASSRRAQFWESHNTPPAGMGVLNLLRPNIQLTGLTPLTCLPVTNLRMSGITSISAQVLFAPGAGNTSYTVTYTPVGGATTTVPAAASPVTLTGLTPQTTYTVTVAGNCTSNGVSPVSTIAFTTASPPPANDDCAAATVLTPAALCTPLITTNRGATASTGVPPPKSTEMGGCFLTGTLIINDVWYSIVVPASGGVTVTTSAVASSSLDDTGLILYTGTCGALTEVACNEDQSTTDFFASASVGGLTPGSTVYARVWSYGVTGQFGICAAPLPANDAAVRAIYALGRVPAGVSQVVQALVTNTGGLPLTNLPVRLNIIGGTVLTETKTVATLAPGASTTVSFTPYMSNDIGNNQLTVSVPADGVSTNNSQIYTQLVTTNTFSYANTTVPSQIVGFGATTTGAFVVRYTTPVARSLTGITAALADNNSVGQTVYGVVVSSTGAVVARTPDYVVTAADINQRKTFALATPLVLAAGDFYVGLVQTAASIGRPRYFPLSILPENPTRPGTYFAVAPFSAATGGTLVDASSSSSGVLIVEAETSMVLASTSAALSQAIDLFPNPSTGRATLAIREAKAVGPLRVEVTNLLGQVVHAAAVRDNAKNELDLSGLAAGVYVLRVQAGSAYSIRQLVLTK